MLPDFHPRADSPLVPAQAATAEPGRCLRRRFAFAVAFYLIANL